MWLVATTCTFRWVSSLAPAADAGRASAATRGRRREKGKESGNKTALSNPLPINILPHRSGRSGRVPSCLSSAAAPSWSGLLWSLAVISWSDRHCSNYSECAALLDSMLGVNLNNGRIKKNNAFNSTGLKFWFFFSPKGHEYVNMLNRANVLLLASCDF